MKQSQFYKLLDIVEDIKKVDAMIKLHSDHDDSSFMLDQYLARKDKLVGILIDELVSPSLRSMRSMKTIKLIIDKYYPNLENKYDLSKADDFTKLELAI
jgi:hypothetical protein